MKRPRVPSAPVRLASLLFLLSLSFALPACATRASSYEEQANIMGTVFTIKLQGPGDHARAAKAAFDEIRRIDRLLSTYKEDSEISEVNRDAFGRPVSVGQDFRAVLAASRIYFDASGGAFDPTVYPLMKLWGFTKKSGHLPSAEELRTATLLVGLEEVLSDEKGNTVRFSQEGMALDFGGIAKGYAVDRAAGALKKHGVKNAIIDAGGNFYAIGSRADGAPWQAGIRHPLRPDEVIARLPVSEMGVATSGNYERFFEIKGRKYCHIMDPRTGMPVEGMLSATIIADTAMAADALSTSVFVLGSEKGMQLIEQLPGVEGMLIYQESDSPENFKILVSSGLKDHIELLLTPTD